MKSLKPFEISFSGINLVEASAGTGKTYNITSLYIRALIELDVTVGNLLVVTYTEAATKELKDRLLNRIRESIKVLKDQEISDEDDQFLKDLAEYVSNPTGAVNKLEQGVRNFDEAAIYTIHGFCYQSLQEQAFESRAMYDAEMIGDDFELVWEAVDDYWRNWTAEISEDDKKKLLLKLISSEGYNPEKLADELSSYIGKPYLHILPEEIEKKHIEQKLSELLDIYTRLREIWFKEKETLFTLLDTGNLSYYTTNKLNKWFGLMDDFLESEVPELDTFTQFYRFEQHEIDNSLNKKARETNVQPPEHEFFKLAGAFSEALGVVKEYVIVFKKELLFYLREELKHKKEDQQVLSYDDLLLQLREALLDENRGKKLAQQIRRKYPVALVDEFQDTDPNQYEIFRQIYRGYSENSALFMIGDPKQSIYSFRGADIFSYIEARRDAPEENMFSLDKNFRSAPILLEGLNTIWGNHDNPFILEDITFSPTAPGKTADAYDSLYEYGKTHPPVRFRFFAKDDTGKKSLASLAAEDVADEIKRLIDDGKREKISIGQSPVEAKDIAVLVRTHNQAGLMREALQKRGIKSVQYSDRSVFKSEEAYYMEVFLQAIAEPSNESLIKTALSLPFVSFSANDLLDIENDEKKWIEILDRFARWNEQWHKQGFAAMFRSLLQDAKISENVINLPNGERILTNILHLGELMQSKAQENGSSHHSLIKWLSRKRKEDGKKRDEEQLRLESDQELVKIVTMHRSKGLEYPVVFCPFLWYGPKYSDSGQPLVYHDENRNAILDLTGKKDENRTAKMFQSNLEDLAESLRLAYVAMTRAKHCLYLSWGYADNSEFSALGYLFQPPEEVQESLRQKLGDGKYNKPNGGNIQEAIVTLCGNYPQLFDSEMSFKVSSSQLNLLDEESKTSPVARKFKRETIDSGFNISSFSSLASSSENDPDIPDYDQFVVNRNLQESAPREKSIFSFPRGPQPGTCIHKIFEEIDFQDLADLPAVVAESLSNYGIDTDWQQIITENITTVLNKRLLKGDSLFSLSKLSREDRRSELEFYFKSDAAKLSDLLSIIRESEIASSTFKGYSEAGFLKGFIDLTFEYDGKFYLLDYKTNHLGGHLTEYSFESMKDEIHHHMYDLQYHIYAVALHRFLNTKIPDYSYKSHFGGALYLFVRGINEDGNEGIYFDRPKKSVIEKLDNYLNGGDHG